MTDNKEERPSYVGCIFREEQPLVASVEVTCAVCKCELWCSKAMREEYPDIEPICIGCLIEVIAEEGEQEIGVKPISRDALKAMGQDDEDVDDLVERATHVINTIASWINAKPE